MLLSRYILREVVTNWLVVTGVLLVVLLTNTLARVLERAAEQQYPQDVVLELIGLGTMQYLVFVVPVGLLLGIVLALGRLYHDSEMAAALACGVGPGVVYRPVVLLTVLVTAALAWLTLYFAPAATARTLALRSEAAQAGQFAPISPGRFRTFGGGDVVVYAQGVDGEGALQNVFVERQRDGRVEVALAQRARHAIGADGLTHTITLFDGERFEGTPGSPQFRIVRFSEQVIPVEVPRVTDPVESREAVPTAELLETPGLASRAELEWRVALPVMCLVLTFIAVPLSRLRPREGRYARFGLAILIYFAYSNLLAAGKVWIERGTTPDFLGLWWIHFAIVALAALLLLTPRALARIRHRRPA